MKKSRSYLLNSLVPVLVVFLFVLHGSSSGGTIAQPNQLQSTDPKFIPIAPISDGQITSVTTLPVGLWYTGTTVKVQWQWPGFVNFPANVTLWSGSQQVATIVSGRTNTYVNWDVPLNFSSGSYTIRVQSSKNPNNHSEAAVSIENSTLSIVSPKVGQTWIAGTANQVVWSFQGKPGPLKLELIPVSGGSAQLIASNIPWGILGAGSFNWLVPGNINAGNYQIKITSTGNSLITAQSQTFSVQKLGTVGIIVSDPNNAPIDGATVTTNVNGAARSVTTQTNGQALFNALPTGTYTFTATKPGYFPDGTTETKVILANGATQSAMIKLKRGQGTVKIIVKDGANPIQGMPVWVGNSPDGRGSSTSADGSMTLTYFPTGTWPVDVQAQVYNRYHSPHYVDAKANVTVTPGATSTVTVSMQRFGWANVKITDGAMPIYNAYVCETDNLNPNVKVGCIYKTDATGTVKVELAPGVRTLQASVDGYKSAFFSINITSGGTTNQTITMTKF